MPNYRPGIHGDGANKSLSNLSDTAVNISLNMQGNKIFNLGDPDNPQDAATKAYVDAQIVGSGANTSLSNLVDPVQPNKNIDMQSSQMIINLPIPMSDGDAANKKYADDLIDSVMNYIGDNFANKTLSNLVAPTSINQNLLSASDTNLLGSTDFPFGEANIYNIYTNVIRNENASETSYAQVKIKFGQSVADPARITLDCDDDNSGPPGIVEVLNALFVVADGAADPPGVAGAIYFNTTSNKFRGYNGTAWVDLG